MFEKFRNIWVYVDIKGRCIIRYVNTSKIIKLLKRKVQNKINYGLLRQATRYHKIFQLTFDVKNLTLNDKNKRIEKFVFKSLLIN